MANSYLIRHRKDTFKDFVEDYKYRVYSIDMKLKQKNMQEEEERNVNKRLHNVQNKVKSINEQLKQMQKDS